MELPYDVWILRILRKLSLFEGITPNHHLANPPGSSAFAGAYCALTCSVNERGFASSRILEVHGERTIKRTFDPGSRIALHSKDLGMAFGRCPEPGLVATQYCDGSRDVS